MRTQIVRLIVVVLCVVIAPVSVQSQSLDVQVEPSVFLPVAGSSTLFGIGGGADLGLAWTVPSLSLVSLVGNVGYAALPTPAGTLLHAVPFTAGVRLNIDLASFLSLFAAVRGGGYFAMHQTANEFNVAASGGAGVRISLGRYVTLGIRGSFLGLLTSGDPLYTGVSLGISGALSTEIFAGGPRIRLEINELAPVFPVLYKWYDSHGLGAVSVSNNGQSPAEDVKVTFYSPEFMDGPQQLAAVDILEPGESMEIPLNALFSDRLLSVTSPTSVAGILAATFSAGDVEKREELSEALTVLNRNAVTWDNDLRAASYVTPTDPVVLRFSKEVSGGVRSDASGIGDSAFRHAIAAYNAIRAYGIDYVIDPNSAYAELSGKTDQLDYLQFPRETLLYGSGDCDDQTALYCAILEAVGFSTAFVTVPGHIFPAVKLDLTPDQVERMFSNGADRFIFEDGSVYLPVEMTDSTATFLTAWTVGVQQYQEAGREARVTPVADGWDTYGKIGLRDAEPDLDYPSWSEIEHGYGSQIVQIIRAELDPQLEVLERQIEDRGSSPRLLNRVATLYARFGLYEEAEEVLQRILSDSEYVPAIVNMGNIKIAQGAVAEAVTIFDHALRLEADYPLALSGKARALYNAGDIAQAREIVQTLQVLDDAAAGRLAFIGAGDVDDVSRASAAGQGSGPFDWAE